MCHFLHPTRFPLLSRFAAMLAVFLLPLTLCAELEISAKAVKSKTEGSYDFWVIRIQLVNTGKTPIGPLTIQHRQSGYSEIDLSGKRRDNLNHKEGSLKAGVIEPGQRTSLDTPAMDFPNKEGSDRYARSLFESLKVRAWQNGRLVGEFAEKSGPGAKVVWPLSPPPVPAGSEAGVGPWLLLEKDRADFAGRSLGASAAEVMKMLKEQGSGQVTATPTPIHSHPFRMAATDLAGCIFGFDAAKKLTAIEITESAQVKLPDKLVLGQSALTAFDAVFGSGSVPAVLPKGAIQARQFKLPSCRLTLWSTQANPTLASALLIESQP